MIFGPIFLNLCAVLEADVHTQPYLEATAARGGLVKEPRLSQ